MSREPDINDRPSTSEIVRTRDAAPPDFNRKPGWYRQMNADWATHHFGFPSIGSTGKHTASDGSKWVYGLTGTDLWELAEYAPEATEPAKHPMNPSAIPGRFADALWQGRRNADGEPIFELSVTRTEDPDPRATEYRDSPTARRKPVQRTGSFDFLRQFVGQQVEESQHEMDRLEREIKQLRERADELGLLRRKHMHRIEGMTAAVRSLMNLQQRILFGDQRPPGPGIPVEPKAPTGGVRAEHLGMVVTFTKREADTGILQHFVATRAPSRMITAQPWTVRNLTLDSNHGPMSWEQVIELATAGTDAPHRVLRTFCAPIGWEPLDRARTEPTATEEPK